MFSEPTHDNIGDHAIVLAEMAFFKKYFPERSIVEVSDNEDQYVAKSLKPGNGDVIAIHGGGFLGNLWIPWDYVPKNFLKNFPQNKIVLFPNTFFFEKKGAWEKEIEMSRDAYSKHRNLHVFIRDKSVDLVREKIMPDTRERVYSVPDIVLSLDRSEPKFERKGVLLCFRKDKERILDTRTLERLEGELRSRGIESAQTDTSVQYCVPAGAREFEVEQKFNEFRRSRLVITDRLHGMIFATITGTPCIALNNSSKKVQGVYDLWIKNNFPYIKFAGTLDEVFAILNEMLSLGAQRYDTSVFEKYWQEIAYVIARKGE